MHLFSSNFICDHAAAQLLGGFEMKRSDWNSDLLNGDISQLRSCLLFLFFEASLLHVEQSLKCKDDF